RSPRAVCLGRWNPGPSRPTTAIVSQRTPEGHDQAPGGLLVVHRLDPLHDRGEYPFVSLLAPTPPPAHGDGQSTDVPPECLERRVGLAGLVVRCDQGNAPIDQQDLETLLGGAPDLFRELGPPRAN